MLFLGTMVFGTFKILFGEKFARENYLQDNANMAGAIMRNEIEEGIAGAIREGALKCFLRPKKGGTFRPCPRAIWNTEQLRERFDEFDLDPNKPFQSGRPANRKEWIWIEEGSATRFGTLIQTKKTSGHYNDSVSRLFSDTIKELGVKTERRAPKAAAVRQAISEICPYGIPETNQEKVIVEDLRAKASEIFGGSIDAKTVRREIKKIFP
ncbi:hypothetical protein ABVB70_17395 [Agrobacterium radiobacter]|uniref:Uncharacterized protein n=1 Tax=Agrobacterium radiobacter TaxID=362 RepID=A0ABD5LLT4_AGRRD